ETRRSPLGLKARLYTTPTELLRANRSRPVLTSHTLIVSGPAGTVSPVCVTDPRWPLPDAISLPSEDMATVLTDSPCSNGPRSKSPVSPDLTMIVPSELAETNRLPAAPYVRLLTLRW